MRQRLIFFAWYTVSVLGAYESYRANVKKKSAVWADYDPLLNIIDTATGLLEAEVSVKISENAAKIKSTLDKARNPNAFVDEIFN